MYGNDNAREQFKADGGRIDYEEQPATQNLPAREKAIYTVSASIEGQKAYEEVQSADFMGLTKITPDDFLCKYEF